MQNPLLAARLLHRALRYRWRLNRREIAAMLGLLPRGGVCLDIGAHKGAYAWWMARRIGPSGRVFAFEPQQRVAEPTARAFAAAGLARVRVIHAAVSDRSGEASISFRRGSSHGASLDGLSGDDIEQVRVPLLSLDDFAQREALARVDFIKIDVEGHEARVLAGARALIARFTPNLLIEIEARHHAGEHDPVAAARDALEPLGYRCFYFTRAGRHPIESFRAADHQRYGEGYYSNNFLFVHQAASAPAAAHAAATRAG
jgi:FkbM family methyltransferase